MIQILKGKLSTPWGKREFHTTSLSHGLVLPLIYFTNPLPSSIVKELEDVKINQTPNNNSYLSGEIGFNVVTNLSKAIIAYEAQVGEEVSKQTTTQQLIEALDRYASTTNLNYYEDYSSNKEASLKERIFLRAHSRRLRNSRKVRFQSKNSDYKLRLFKWLKRGR